MHTLTKVSAGHYLYRNHHICREDDAVGPAGTSPRYWSISGEIGGPDEDSGHAALPQLKLRVDCINWLDAYLDGDTGRRKKIEKERWRD